MTKRRDITTASQNARKTRTVVLAATTTPLSMSLKTIAVAQQSDNNSRTTTIVTPSENTIKVNATEKNEVIDGKSIDRPILT